MAALLRQKQHTHEAGRHVFLDPRYDAPWDDERAFRRSYWTPALKALGIRYRSPYQLRHTFATMMLMAGVTPAAAAKRMGHSVQMFLKHYAKWIDGEASDREMARLEQSIEALPKVEVPDLGELDEADDDEGIEEETDEETEEEGDEEEPQGDAP